MSFGGDVYYFQSIHECVDIGVGGLVDTSNYKLEVPTLDFHEAGFKRLTVVDFQIWLSRVFTASGDEDTYSTSLFPLPVTSFQSVSV